MDIKNVLTDEDLQERMDKLKSENWLINKMADIIHPGKTIHSLSAKNQIDNWVQHTRPQLLKLLKISENENYKFMYHDIQE